MLNIRLRHLLLALALALLGLTVAVAQTPPPGNWVKDPANPVLGPGALDSWDSGGVLAPAVLAEGTGFQMWYAATGTAVANMAIGRATSSNGSAWVRYANNPVLVSGAPGAWDSAGVEDPAVVKKDGVYHLWYTGHDAAGGRRVGHATSPDGMVWTKDPANPVLQPGPEGAWDVKGVRPGTVLFIGGEYRMWYMGSNVAGTAGIGLATSANGVNWTKHSSNPVLSVQGTGWESQGVYRPAVVFDGTTYRMWYTGVGGDGLPRIGMATSSDGVQWTRAAGNPVLGPGGPGTWDTAAAKQPAVVWKADTSTYHLWYGGTAGNVEAIGHATARGAYTVYLPLIRK